MTTYYLTLAMYIEAESKDIAENTMYDIKFYGAPEVLCKNDVQLGDAYEVIVEKL